MNGRGAPPGESLWRFANVQLDERNHALKVDGHPVSLEDKPLGVLLCLLQAEGELVTKEELFESVWSGRVVTDGVLSQAIKKLRLALGDHERSLVRTIHGHGFRLDVPIALEGAETEIGPRLEFASGESVIGLEGWVLDERMQTRPANELWRIRNDAGEAGVLKLALDARAERALKREVTLNRVLIKELGENPPLVPLVEWQFKQRPHWIRMPWYVAGSLVDWVAAQGGAAQIRLERRVRIVAEAAEAFAKAHAIGVMHKDIKPGNLLVDESGPDPRLMLCDFGSGTATSRSRLAAAGVTVMGFTQTVADAPASGSGSGTATTGTPAYMAPELLNGGVFSERSDVYSLGVMLYQLVSGEMQSPLAHGWEDDIDDAGLRKIIGDACAGRPEKRIAGMHEFSRRLREWTPSSIVKRPPGPADGMRLSAIMFTDMVGYSSLVRTDESVARELLDHHIAAMRTILPKHQGREVEIIGDAFLAEFPSAVLAVLCGVEFQKAQAAYNDTAPAGRQYRIRIGIHIGDVEVRDGRLFGHGVNYAARIEPLSPSGGVAISPQVLNAVEARLNLPFRSLGRKQLKNVAENIEVFALTEAAIRNPESVPAVRKPQRWMRPLGAALAIAVAAAMGFALPRWGHEARSPEIADHQPTIAQAVPRVALLPFDLLGLDDQTRQVMAGLQDALVSELAGNKAWALVTARNLALMDLVDAPPQRIGEVLDSGRLVRGSIQQLGDSIRFNVQLIGASSGETLWGKSLQGQRADLFRLQQELGSAIAVALGGAATANTGSTGVDPQAYEAYLAALSLYRDYSWPGQNPGPIAEMYRQLDIAIAAAPDYLPVHMLAIQAQATGYWWSYRERPQVQAAISGHLAALQALRATPLQQAIAQAASAVYVDEDAARALALLIPNRDAVLDDPDAPQIFLDALRGLGRFQEAADIGQTLITQQPNNVMVRILLMSDLATLGKGAAMAELALQSAQRFPNARFLRGNGIRYAYMMTGDARFVMPGLSWTETAAPANRPVGTRIRLAMAHREGDMARIGDLLQDTSYSDDRWYGTAYEPAALRRARDLHHAGLEPDQVRELAARALELIDAIRVHSDTPARQIAAAQTLALLGQREQADALIEQVRRGFGQERHQLAQINEVEKLAEALALNGNEARLRALLAEFLELGGAVSCGQLLMDYRLAAVPAIPAVRTWLEGRCEPLWADQIAAMERFLAQP